MLKVTLIAILSLFLVCSVNAFHNDYEHKANNYNNYNIKFQKYSYDYEHEFPQMSFYDYQRRFEVKSPYRSFVKYPKMGFRIGDRARPVTHEINKNKTEFRTFAKPVTIEFN